MILRHNNVRLLFIVHSLTILMIFQLNLSLSQQQQLLRVANDKNIKTDSSNVDTNNLKFYIYPFPEKYIVTLCVPPTNTIPEFRFNFTTDNLY